MPARTASSRIGADACPGVFAPHDAADGALARIRLPGGVVSAPALRVVADCADELGDGRVHLTSRGNLQLRGLSRGAPLVERLAAAGLLPSATHERVRNVLASPLSGIAHDPDAREAAVGARGTGSPAADWHGRLSAAVDAAAEARGRGSCDVRGLAAALDRALCARPVLAGLPGRFLFALDDGRGDVAAEEPDLCWRAVSARAGVLLVAGMAVAEVAVADAVRVLLDAAEAFLTLRADSSAVAAAAAAEEPLSLQESHIHAISLLECGFPATSQATATELRAGRGAAWRVAELPDAPARIAAALDLPSCPESHFQDTPRPESGFQDNPAAVPGVVRRDDGGVALVVAPLLGELTVDQVRLLAEAAAGGGAGAHAAAHADTGVGAGVGDGIVVTPWRTVVLPDPSIAAADLAAAGLIVSPGPAAEVSACAGRPGCAKALADVRADVRAALDALWTNRPAGRMHVSGCARRCGAPRGAHVDAVALEGGGYLVDGAARAGLRG